MHFHRQRTNNKKKVVVITLVAVFALVVFGFLLQSPLGDAIRRPLYALNAPFWKTRAAAVETFGSRSAFFKDKATLIAERDALQEEVDALRMQTLTHHITQRAYEELCTRVGRDLDTTKLQAASVLTQSGSVPYDTLVVNLGTDARITEGALVFAFPDVLIGTVTAVYDTTARVQLLSAPGKTTEMTVSTSSIRVEAVGKGRGVFEMLIPQEISLSVGDPIATVGLDQYLTGVVDHITATPGDALQTIHFRLPINLTQLHVVFIER